MSIVHLKIKIKSLAADAQFIRHEEQKRIGSGRWLRAHNQASGVEYSLYNSLIDHRRKDLRPIQRIAQLAYGFLRNVPYRNIENHVPMADSVYLRGTGEKGFKYPDFEAVFKEAAKFSGTEIRILQQRFAQWKDEAKLDQDFTVAKTPRVRVPWDGTPGKSARRSTTAA